MLKAKYLTKEEAYILHEIRKTQPYKTRYQKDKGVTKQIIYNFLKEHKEGYVSQIARFCAISPSAAKYHLDNLVDEGKIKRREYWDKTDPWETRQRACGSYLLMDSEKDTS